VGAGAGLRVVLHREGLEFGMAQALQGVVVQVDVGDLYRRVGDGVQVHGKAVILGSDLHPAVEKIFHRLVAPPVAELELKGAPAQGQSQELVTQADAEHRLLAQALIELHAVVVKDHFFAGPLLPTFIDFKLSITYFSEYFF